MSHGTHMNESWYSYVSESWHTYERHASGFLGVLWVMAHIWMNHGTRMNESWYTSVSELWHTYERHASGFLGSLWVMTHVWMSHGTNMIESRLHRCEWVMAHIRVARTWFLQFVMVHGTHMNASCNTYDWVTVHLCEWVMAHIWAACKCLLW